MQSAKRYAVFCLVVSIGAAASAQGDDVKHPKIPEPGTTQMIPSVEGGALFKAHCAACHGIDAKGNGPMSEWLKVKTPDLTRIRIRAGGTFPLAHVQRIISGEDSVKSGHGTREMPVWGPIFSQVADDRDWGRVRVYNLAVFLQGLQQNQ